METISDEQKIEFAKKEFPGQPVNLGNGDWWYIQAGNILGENLHYEYWGGKVSLHIEGPDWRPLRNFLRNQVFDSRIVPSHWWRQDCSWTLQKTPCDWDEIKQCFIEIDRIMRPHLLSFERLQGFKKQKELNAQTGDVYASKIKLIDLIGVKNLRIPEYQRPYRWTHKNVEQLLNDINNARINGKNDYLIGSVILHKNSCENGSTTLDIVDGQQRLTTICLIAKALEYVGVLPSLEYNHSDSFIHIQENFAFIKDWIKININDLRNFLDYILYNCQFVQIIVTKLPEAFQLFETQNGRGKELEAYNLLKAFHIRAMLDSSIKDKIDCDVRWENAALFMSETGEQRDLLRQLINEHLFRTRIWSRNEEALKFMRKDVDEFKGLTIGRDNQLEFAYQNILIQQQIAAALMRNMNQGLFKVKNRFIHGDPDNISPFTSINQMIVNGKPFFDYVETYVEIYKRLFIQKETSQLSKFKNFYNDYCLYDGCHRSGDTYVRQVFKSAIILLFDRFGEEGVNYLYESLYLCIYRIRLEKKQVRYSSLTRPSVSGSVFTIIQNAKNVSDLSELKRKGNEYAKQTNFVFNVPVIKSFFEKRR